MKTKGTSKSEFKKKYGDADLDLKNVRPEEIKVRITTFLDLDVLETLKAQAKDLGSCSKTDPRKT